MTLEHLDDICILRIQGLLTFGSQMEDLHAVKQEMASRRCIRLLVDISAIPFLTSIEIGLLVGLYSSVVGRANGRYILVGPNPRVRRILDLTRLSNIIAIAEDTDFGLAMIREAAAEPTANCVKGVGLAQRESRHV